MSISTKRIPTLTNMHQLLLWIKSGTKSIVMCKKLAMTEVLHIYLSCNEGGLLAISPNNFKLLQTTSNSSVIKVFDRQFH